MWCKEMLSVTVLFFAVFLQPCESTQNNMNYRAGNLRLMSDLLRDYNPDVIPIPSSGAPVNLTLTLLLIDILEVDIDKNQVEMLFYLYKEYKDEGLMWNPDDYGIDSLRVNRLKIWQPDVVFESDIGSVSHQPEGSNLALVKSDGTVSVFDKRRVRTLCQVYALSDRHAAECPIKVASAMYDRDLLWLNAPTSNSYSGLLFSNSSKYILISISSRKDTLRYATASYEEMVFTSTFGRITPPNDK
ncbi:acetylcholine receptor subunit alpha [Plakobranchus ocellatus]|uniref:Acetylcholine receptor subunit alpha n=1 Tax=Plakobranchus ocellatus TaxID=259542 RepID=A0AAV4C4W3_9GAST|nr:acetylcholine receptor subunit alpha [Plakobranchus ocellatus]